MPSEILADFTSHPSITALLTSPSHTLHPPSRSLPPPFSTQAPQYLFTRTLFTPTTIRAWRHLTSHSPPSGAISREQVLVLSLGAELSGHADHLSGGMYGVILDQVSGLCSFAEVGTKSVTTELTVRFLRSVRLPGVVVARAWMVRREDGEGKGKDGRDEEGRGGRFWIESEVTDGDGRRCAEGSAVFYIRGEQRRNSGREGKGAKDGKEQESRAGKKDSEGKAKL